MCVCACVHTHRGVGVVVVVHAPLYLSIHEHEGHKRMLGMSSVTLLPIPLRRSQSSPPLFLPRNLDLRSLQIGWLWANKSQLASQECELQSVPDLWLVTWKLDPNCGPQDCIANVLNHWVISMALLFEVQEDLHIRVKTLESSQLTKGNGLAYFCYPK